MKNNRNHIIILFFVTIIAAIYITGCGKSDLETTEKKLEMALQSENDNSQNTLSPMESEESSDIIEVQDESMDEDQESSESRFLDADSLLLQNGEVSEETGILKDTEEAQSASSQDMLPEETTDKSQTETEVVTELVDGLTDEQRNSLNMLNYLTVLTQEINDSKSSRLFVENAYNSLINNTNPNAVDSRTHAQLTNILDTLEGYRMVDVKRERLKYIYEQNCARAMREAIPKPADILNVVLSGNYLKAAASVLYMAVDSYSSYNDYMQQTEMNYLKDGWELDDEEATELHNSRKNAFSYMLSMVRENELPGDYALNEEAVETFVSWKNNTNVIRRISFLESNQATYEVYGTYWLTLSQSYYENGDYAKCLEAIQKYEEMSSRIFRKDYEYAKTLPMGIIAAKSVYYNKYSYVEKAKKYAEGILSNIDVKDWNLSYFVAHAYIDFYKQTNDKEYLEKAYQLIFDNVNYLVDEQLALNEKFLDAVVDVQAPKDALKREKEEIKQYNKMLKELRKTELPPISEALVLNCELLFTLADELDLPTQEKKKINGILHGNDGCLFLTKSLENHYTYGENVVMDTNSVEVVFDGNSITIPASCVSENAVITMTVEEPAQKRIFNNWTVDSVDRKKNASFENFTVKYKNASAKSFKYADGMKVTITVTPVSDYASESMSFTFTVKTKGTVIKTTYFERVS